MNTLELRILIEQVLGEIENREVESIEAYLSTDGQRIDLKIDNKTFKILITQEDAV